MSPKKNRLNLLLRGWLPEKTAKIKTRQFSPPKTLVVTASVIAVSLLLLNFLLETFMIRPNPALNWRSTEPSYPYVSGSINGIPCLILGVKETDEIKNWIISGRWFLEEYDANRSVIGLSDTLCERLNINITLMDLGQLNVTVTVVVGNFSTECLVINVFEDRVKYAVSGYGAKDEYDAMILMNLLPENITWNYTEWKRDPKADDDRDGLSNEVETRLGSDPDNWDTDGDGISDGLEYVMNASLSATAAPIPQIAAPIAIGAVGILAFYRKKRNKETAT